MNFLRFSDLKARRIVGNWPTLRRWVEREAFPPGRMLGPNSRAWTEEEIDHWLASRPPAASSTPMITGGANQPRVLQAANLGAQTLVSVKQSGPLTGPAPSIHPNAQFSSRRRVPALVKGHGNGP